MITTIILYLAITCLWGSTWLAIQHQVHSTVPPVWSIIYRFGMASLLMAFYCLIRRIPLNFTRREHGYFLLQGIFLTSINYYFFYLGSQYLLSGIISLVFSTIIIVNIFTSRLILKHPITTRLLGGATIGILGLCIVFISELSGMHNVKELQFNSDMLKGIILCLIATLSASLGTIVAAHNRRQKLPILQTNTISMAYGTLCTLFIALITHQFPHVDFSPEYLMSLFYLIVPGTVIAFGVYVALVGRIGPGQAGYVFVAIPIVALTLSTLFENFHWTRLTFLGILLTLLGNVLVMLKPKSRLIPNSETPTANV